MAVKLKRSVFIGLGGTGMKSILKTKQLYVEAFGEVPEIIGFLGIDTSTEEFAKSLRSYDGKDIKLEANEQVKLPMSGPLDYYHTHKDRFSWIHKMNVPALTGLSANGAGQIRTNGRFSFTINYSNIESSIRNVVNRVSNATNDGKDKWELVDDKIQIYLVFSLSGGTGCGTFLNTAYLIKDLYGDGCVLQAYAVLPNVFRGAGQFVGANAYGALLDTDYLMSHTDADHPFEYSLLDEDRKSYLAPFDLVYLIDDKNKNGDTYTDANQLYTMIGQALLAISGSIGSASAADLDNFKQLMIDGSLDIEDKKSWVSGMGLCEILVNPKKLSIKYVLQASQKLASDLIGFADPNRVDEITMAWVNLNNLREHEDDQLLNSLYDLNKFPDHAITSSKASKAEIESQAYVNDAINQATKSIAQNYDQKIDSAKKSFEAKLIDIVNTEGGLATAKGFIDKFNDAVNLYLNEMKEELVILSQKLPIFKSSISDIIEDWNHKKLFSKTDFAGDLAEAQLEYVRADVDRIRHEKAQQFFLELKDYSSTFISTIDEITKRLEVVAKGFRERLSEIEYTSNDVSPFQIDLAKDYIVEGDKDVDCTISKFADCLEGTILSIADSTSNELSEKIEGFATTLAGASFDHLSIEAIILGLSEEDKRKLFEKALRKAEIVLDVENKGYTNEGSLRNALYVSVVGGKDGAIANDKVISGLLEAETRDTKPTFAVAPTNKSLMIFRQKGVFPIFQLATVTSKQRDYERHSEKKSFSFDANLQSRLEDLHYSFQPNQQKEDDVLEIWVKGLIHGLIKREGQRYVVQSPGLCEGDGSNDYWFKLKAADEGQGTEARAYAYDDFKSRKRILKSKGDLLAKIREIEDQMGRAETTKLYKAVKECSYEEYVRDYSNCNIAASTINTSLSYQKTKAVLKDEDSYRRNKLVESLDNR